MTNNYYSQKIFLAAVDKKDNIIGPVERWQAHKKNILHRGFTCVLKYQNQFLLQHRKHPVFDKLYDLSFSSHPIYINNKLQSMEEAIYQTLKREWDLKKNDLKPELKFVDKFYYQAKDPKTVYSEHEIDYLYVVELNRLPKPNPDFAYGYNLFKKKDILNSQLLNFNSLCPWVPKIIESKFFLTL